jgi:tRNA A-37 threonylcarbamoyl transferase component Bud32
MPPMFSWKPAKVADEAERIVITCHLLPVSALLSISAVLIGLSALSWFFISTSAGNLVAFLGGMIWIPLAIAAALRLKVVVSPLGIKALGNLHHQTLFGKTGRGWEDLHSIRLRKFSSANALLERIGRNQTGRLVKPSGSERLRQWLGRGWMKQGFIVFDFRSGGSLPFPLAGFSSRAIDDLFVALSRFADPMSLNADVIALQRDVLTGTPVNLTPSYTKMWEESLRQQFEATNFVPLVGGTPVQSGKLKVLLLLACGGQSSVYLVTDNQGSRFILKELSAAVDDSAMLEKLHTMFAREASLLAKLDHPNIVKILDSFVDNNRDYLLLNFVPGMTLRQHVDMNGPFSEDEVLQIGRTMSTVVKYLHEQAPPVIHRDITPDNFVIRDYDREVVLIDFGAASEYVGKVTGTMIGKQCYIPPEQFRGQSVPQSDLYAIGATLFFLLTGKDPVPITTSKPSAVLPSVSPKLDAIIVRLTDHEPENRFQSARELAKELEDSYFHQTQVVA